MDIEYLRAEAKKFDDSEYKLSKHSKLNLNTMALRHKKENELRASIREQILEGASDEFRQAFLGFGLGILPSPVTIPKWMFRHYDVPSLNLTDVQKVALAHIIYFTDPCYMTGYLACSGHIETWCKCSVKEADEALDEMEYRAFAYKYEYPLEYCKGHKRNTGYILNIGHLHKLLNGYKEEIWI